MNVAVESPELGRSIIAGGYQTNLHEHGKGFPLMLIHGSGPGALPRRGPSPSRRGDHRRAGVFGGW